MNQSSLNLTISQSIEGFILHKTAQGRSQRMIEPTHRFGRGNEILETANRACSNLTNVFGLWTPEPV
jgi:hypothetical protein